MEFPATFLVDVALTLGDARELFHLARVCRAWKAALTNDTTFVAHLKARFLHDLSRAWRWEDHHDDIPHGGDEFVCGLPYRARPVALNVGPPIRVFDDVPPYCAVNHVLVVFGWSVRAVHLWKGIRFRHGTPIAYNVRCERCSRTYKMEATCMREYVNEFYALEAAGV